MEAVIEIKDQLNQIYSLSEAKDREIQSYLQKITDAIDNFSDFEASSKRKSDILLSVEYLFVKVRVCVEFESIKVKGILNSQDTPQSLRPFFQKRDVYLSQISAKLTLIRDDISVLQKLQYSNSFKN